MDATIAVSQSGVNKLVQDLLSAAHYSKSASASWGPFTVGYSVSASVSGGTVELVDSPIQLIRVHDFNISASAGVHIGFDLGNILPQICIPPVQVCVDIPFLGHVCTPQFCVPWPSIDVPLTIPLSVNVSADFGLEVTDGGTKWNVVLLVYPLSLVIDPTPTISAILNAVEAYVDGVLNGIPLIGGLIADLVNAIIGALQSVIGAIAGAIDTLIHEVILLIDIFSPTIPITLISFNKVEVVLPASGPGDPDVDITIAALTAQIAQQELVAAASFA
jgi:hypothetical protein